MKTVVAGALGECVHVAGVRNFLRLAEAAGWRTVFLGPAVPIEQFLEAVHAELADGRLLVGVSYRLTPETGERLLGEFAEAADDLHAGRALCLWRHAAGGRARRALGFFERVFDGSEGADEVLAYLKGETRCFPCRRVFSANHRRAHRLESALPAPPPPLRPADHGSHPAGHRTDRRRRRAGCDLAGHRPGCAGELLPPRAPGPAPHGRRRRAGAHAGRLPRPLCRQPRGQLSRCCAPIPAPTISSAWPRCTWRRSTSPGAPSRSSGSTRWTAAARGTWKARSASTSR